MSSDFKKFLIIAHEANMLSRMEDEKVRSYSGRCMYGRNCLGITCGTPSLVMMRLCEAAAELTRREVDDAEDFRVSELIRDEIREDSMGQESIVYFPRLEWDQEEYEEVYKEKIGLLPQDHE